MDGFYARCGGTEEWLAVRTRHRFFATMGTPKDTSCVVHNKSAIGIEKSFIYCFNM